jgi:WD40 repeat protein
VNVWDIQPPGFQAIGRRVDEFPFLHPLADIAISPDGKHVATAVYSDKKHDRIDLKVWGSQTGQELLALEGLAGQIRNVKVAFSPDSKRLAGTIKSLAKVWDVQTGKEIVSIKDENLAAAAAFSPDGKTLAVGGLGLGERGKKSPAIMTLWDAQTGMEIRSFKAPPDIFIQPMASSPDGKRLFGDGSGMRDPFSTVKVWDARTGKQLPFSKGTAAMALSPTANAWLVSVRTGQ